MECHTIVIWNNSNVPIRYWYVDYKNGARCVYKVEDDNHETRDIITLMDQRFISYVRRNDFNVPIRFYFGKCGQ